VTTYHEPPLSAPQKVSVPLPTRQPVVTYTLIAICGVVFLLQVATNQWLGTDWPAEVGAKVNDAIMRGELWRLFTPMFLHASIPHILFNLYALWVIGPGLESNYGHGRYLALYVLGGFTGNVASFLFSPVASVGASTAIFGLLGAEGVLIYQNRRLFGKVAQKALTNVILIAAVNLAIGLSPGIDNWGHVGGLIGGTLFAWFGGPLLQLEGIFPTLSITDRREAHQVWAAGIVTAGIFACLTALGIVLKS
jgi:rhomboid protease GluP